MEKIFKNKIFLFFILALLIFIGAGYFYFQKAINTPKGGEVMKVITIEKGEGSKIISQKLEKEGIIKSAFIFDLYVFLYKKSKNLKAGEYLLSSSMSIVQIVKTLEEGREPFLKITIPEGWKIKEIASYLEKEKIFSQKDFLAEVNNVSKWQNEFDFLKKVPSKNNLEGFLYPDTYFLSEKSRPEDLVRKMLSNFQKKILGEFSEEIEKSSFSLYQIVILASIIEKEAATYSDRVIISDIFQKRLAKNIPLQSCATVEFVLDTKKRVLSLQDIKVNSPYNTYLYPGLPPGPICNPSIESIKAVLYPQKTEYWYFLSTPDGKTYFQKTAAEHEAAKRLYLK